LEGSSIYEPSGKITTGRYKEDECDSEDADLVEDDELLLLLLAVLLLLSGIENELLVVAIVGTVEGEPELPFLSVDSR
jgi:hypothetical protein